MAASKARAEQFLDELASMTYELRTKHGIPQEDLIFEPMVRIDEFISLSESFKNVSKQS